MAESLRGGLSLCASGFGFWSHDIGGFEQTTIPTVRGAVYKRWCAFGLLSSHSRLHGSSSYRVPWLYDEAGQPGPTAAPGLTPSPAPQPTPTRATRAPRGPICLPCGGAMLAPLLVAGAALLLRLKT